MNITAASPEFRGRLPTESVGKRPRKLARTGFPGAVGRISGESTGFPTHRVIRAASDLVPGRQWIGIPPPRRNIRPAAITVL